MQSKLILIEGIPGSGKSTTARFLNDWLAGQGLSTYLFREGQPGHPTDPDGMAFLDNALYTELVNTHEQYRYDIEDHTAFQYGGYVVNYRRMNQERRVSDTLYEALEAHDIYSTVSPEKYREITEGMWLAFASQAAVEEGIYIFECCFLQNPYTVLVGRHNRPPEEARAHVEALCAAVDPLFPLAVYVDAGDAESVLRRAADERPREWLDFVIEYVTGQGYGKAHGLHGMEGAIRFYSEMKAFMEQTLTVLDIPLMRAELAREGWERARQEMKMFLKAESGYWFSEA